MINPRQRSELGASSRTTLGVFGSGFKPPTALIPGLYAWGLFDNALGKNLTVWDGDEWINVGTEDTPPPTQVQIDMLNYTPARAGWPRGLLIPSPDGCVLFDGTDYLPLGFAGRVRVELDAYGKFWTVAGSIGVSGSMVIRCYDPGTGTTTDHPMVLSSNLLPTIGIWLIDDDLVVHHENMTELDGVTVSRIARIDVATGTVHTVRFTDPVLGAEGESYWLPGGSSPERRGMPLSRFNMQVDAQGEWMWVCENLPTFVNVSQTDSGIPGIVGGIITAQSPPTPTPRGQGWGVMVGVWDRANRGLRTKTLGDGGPLQMFRDGTVTFAAGGWISNLNAYSYIGSNSAAGKLIAVNQLRPFIRTVGFARTYTWGSYNPIYRSFWDFSPLTTGLSFATIVNGNSNLGSMAMTNAGSPPGAPSSSNDRQFAYQNTERPALAWGPTGLSSTAERAVYAVNLLNQWEKIGVFGNAGTLLASICNVPVS